MRRTRSSLAFNEVRIHKRRLRTLAYDETDRKIYASERAVRRGYPACGATGSSIHPGQQVYDRVMPSRKASRRQEIALFNLTEIERPKVSPRVPTRESSASSRPIPLAHREPCLRTCPTETAERERERDTHWRERLDRSTCVHRERASTYDGVRTVTWNARGRARGRASYGEHVRGERERERETRSTGSVGEIQRVGAKSGPAWWWRWWQWWESSMLPMVEVEKEEGGRKGRPHGDSLFLSLSLSGERGKETGDSGATRRERGVGRERERVCVERTAARERREARRPACGSDSVSPERPSRVPRGGAAFPCSNVHDTAVTRIQPHATPASHTHTHTHTRGTRIRFTWPCTHAWPTHTIVEPWKGARTCVCSVSHTHKHTARSTHVYIHVHTCFFGREKHADFSRRETIIATVRRRACLSRLSGTGACWPGIYTVENQRGSNHPPRSGNQLSAAWMLPTSKPPCVDRVFSVNSMEISSMEHVERTIARVTVRSAMYQSVFTFVRFGIDWTTVTFEPNVSWQKFAHIFDILRVKQPERASNYPLVARVDFKSNCEVISRNWDSVRRWLA